MDRLRPKVLFIATFPPPVHGSAVVSQQIKESYVINNCFDISYINMGMSRSIEEIGNKSLFLNFKKLFRFIHSFFKVFFLLLAHKYDICYCAITCHGRGFLKDAPFVLLCKLFRRKIIIHQHNKGMSSDIERPVFRWLLPLVYKNVKVILLSWHLYPDIEKVVKKGDILICPNGINTITDQDLNCKYNSVPNILYLSNLLIDKGVLILLDALKILKDKGYSFECNFVGGESKDLNSDKFYKEIQKRGLSNIVQYHGKQYGENKDSFFRKADMFVLPSLNEAFPLVNLEAMQYKLPVISTNVGGIPDEIIDGVNGLLVEPGDVTELAKALIKLMENPQERMEMGLRGYEMYINKFTHECFEQNIIRIMDSMVM